VDRPSPASRADLKLTHYQDVPEPDEDAPLLEEDVPEPDEDAPLLEEDAPEPEKRVPHLEEDAPLLEEPRYGPGVVGGAGMGPKSGTGCPGSEGTWMKPLAAA
jgi:hypothetical protein